MSDQICLDLPPVPVEDFPQVKEEAMPNPDRIDDALRTFRTGMGSLQTLSALQGAQIIVNAMDELRAHMDRQFALVNRQLAEIGVSGPVVRASLQNAETRQQNGYCSKASEPLLALVNIATGEEIQPFPATAGDLQRWTGPQMRTVLEALGALPPTQISTDALRRMLRAKIGLRQEKADPA
ncbi:MAG: hypothetical protein M1826_006933 [Phylliscum demangeonii]|nr:MAG: hypothetical protein M1826_006933 [Phylliscum demangeonii]